MLHTPFVSGVRKVTLGRASAPAGTTHTGRFIARLRAGTADACSQYVARHCMMLQNVVAKVGITRKMDIGRFASTRPYAHEPPNFPAAAVIHVVHTGATTVLLFNTGCVVVVGSKSLEQTIYALNSLRAALDAEGVVTGMSDFQPVNEVYVARLEAVDGSPTAINLGRIQQIYGGAAIWEPHAFPGLRIKVHGMLIILFDGGSIAGVGGLEARLVRKETDTVAALCSANPGTALPAKEFRHQWRLDARSAGMADLPLPPPLAETK